VAVAAAALVVGLAAPLVPAPLVAVAAAAVAVGLAAPLAAGAGAPVAVGAKGFRVGSTITGGVGAVMAATSHARLGAAGTCFERPCQVRSTGCHRQGEAKPDYNLRVGMWLGDT